MTKDELIQFCAEKGVPLPETCEKLNWQGETKFYWIKAQKDGAWHFSFKKGSRLVAHDGFNWYETSFENVYYKVAAHQFHEIWKVMPKEIWRKKTAI